MRSSSRRTVAYCDLAPSRGRSWSCRVRATVPHAIRRLLTVSVENPVEKRRCEVHDRRANPSILAVCTIVVRPLHVRRRSAHSLRAAQSHDHTCPIILAFTAACLNQSSASPTHLLGTPLKIVVADDLPASALDLLRAEGWEVDARTGRAPDQLAADLADADAHRRSQRDQGHRRASSPPRRSCASSPARAPASTTSTSPPPAPAASSS